MMLLFIDTETTGLPDKRLPRTHPAQPRIVQLAAWLGEEMNDPRVTVNGVSPLRHVASLNAIIRPAGWTIPERATTVHGFTTERALALGEDAESVLARLLLLIAQADYASPGEALLIAHNFDFDYWMLLAELIHADLPTYQPALLHPFCTMKALTPRMRLPGRWPGQFKWPSLAEAHRYCFDRDFDNAHTAMGDVLACKDIYLHGRSQSWWP